MANMTSRRYNNVFSSYALTKVGVAAEEFFYQLLFNPGARKDGLSSTVSKAAAKFTETLSKPMTSVMYIAGTAMCPALNRKALDERDHVEKLVVRLIPRPSPGNCFLGDVVALESPLGAANAQNVMVRRVAALEGQEMVSDADDVESFVIPTGHCWVLADNPELKPPNVIDSRTFGHIPITNVIGRVIYRAASLTDHEPVVNSHDAVVADRYVIDGEVDIQQLFPDSENDIGATDNKPESDNSSGPDSTSKQE